MDEGREGVVSELPKDHVQLVGLKLGGMGIKYVPELLQWHDFPVDIICAIDVRFPWGSMICCCRFARCRRW